MSAARGVGSGVHRLEPMRDQVVAAGAQQRHDLIHGSDAVVRLDECVFEIIALGATRTRLLKARSHNGRGLDSGDAV